jgi:hypothetical protein
VIWPLLVLLAAAEPTCKTADQRVEALIEAKLKEANGTEYCQARLYHTIDDLDGDGQGDFVVVFSVEAAAGGNNSVQYLAVFPSGSQWAPVVVKVGQRGERYIDGIEVRPDRLLVLHTSEYEPGDAMCCPSGEGQLTYRLEKGKISAVTGAPPNKQMQRTKHG